MEDHQRPLAAPLSRERPVPDRSWRRKVFSEAVTAAKLPAMRPYDLRHSLASLMIAEGRSILEVAEQLGHAPTMTLDVYGHVLAAVDGTTASHTHTHTHRRATACRVVVRRLLTVCRVARTRGGTFLIWRNGEDTEESRRAAQREESSNVVARPPDA